MALPSGPRPGDVAVLACSCGEPGCGAVVATIRLTKGIVTWDLRTSDGDPVDAGPYTFRRSRYEAALRQVEIEA